MRVLHVNNHLGFGGGTERYLMGVLPALRERGHEAGLVYGHDLGGASIPGSASWKRPWLGHYMSSFAAADAADAARILDEFKPDVVHLHNRVPGRAIRWLSARVPCLRTVHDHETYCFRAKVYFGTETRCGDPLGWACVRSGCLGRTPGAWLFYGRAMRRVEEVLGATRDLPRVLATSSAMKGYLTDNGVEASKVHLLPYFTSLPARPAEPEPGVVFCPARLEKLKGIHRLLEAVPSVRGLKELVIAGTGEYERELRVRAASLGLEQKVRFLGWVPNEGLEPLYARASVCVVPSLWPEPFGIVGLEAMAHARPVAAFDVGGISDWLEDGVTGLLAPPDDVPALAAALSRLLEDRTLARGLGEAGRARVERLYGRKTHLELLEGHYRAVARQGAPA